MEKILTEIRNKSRKIVAESDDILTIKKDSLNTLAQLLKKIQKTKDYNSFAISGISLKEEISLNLFFDTVNFCFTNPKTHMRYRYLDDKRKDFQGSFGLFKSLANANIHWSNLQEVSKLNQSRWQKITQITNDRTLFKGRSRYLRIVGVARYLLSKNILNTYDLIKYCNFDATKIVAFLSKSGYFNDPFLKRAQVCTNRISKILARRNYILLKNIKSLTCMADYRIPQLLYNTYTIEISPELKTSLISEIPLKVDSREESALRASVVVVGEMLSKILKISEAEVDSLLWQLSKKMLDQKLFKIPPMLVTTDRY